MISSSLTLIDVLYITRVLSIYTIDMTKFKSINDKENESISCNVTTEERWMNLNIGEYKFSF